MQTPSRLGLSGCTLYSLTPKSERCPGELPLADEEADSSAVLAGGMVQWEDACRQP